MLTGHNGCIQKAKEIFNGMVESSIRPGAVTFISYCRVVAMQGLLIRDKDCSIKRRRIIR